MPINYALGICGENEFKEYLNLMVQVKSGQVQSLSYEFLDATAEISENALYLRLTYLLPHILDCLSSPTCNLEEIDLFTLPRWYKLDSFLEDILSSSKSLYYFGIHSRLLEESELSAIGKGVSNSTKIEALRLECCNINRSGLNVLTTNIKDFKNLKHIDLTGNHINFYDVVSYDSSFGFQLYMTSNEHNSDRFILTKQQNCILPEQEYFSPKPSYLPLATSQRFQQTCPIPTSTSKINQVKMSHSF